MSKSLPNFLFDAADPAGRVSLDKIFGFSAWSVPAPNAIAADARPNEPESFFVLLQRPRPLHHDHRGGRYRRIPLVHAPVLRHGRGIPACQRPAGRSDRLAPACGDRGDRHLGDSANESSTGCSRADCCGVGGAERPAVPRLSGVAFCGAATGRNCGSHRPHCHRSHPSCTHGLGRRPGGRQTHAHPGGLGGRRDQSSEFDQPRGRQRIGDVRRLGCGPLHHCNEDNVLPIGGFDGQIRPLRWRHSRISSVKDSSGSCSLER